jgi:hypothetical protein
MNKVFKGLPVDPTPEEILEHIKLRQQTERMIGGTVRRWAPEPEVEIRKDKRRKENRTTK